MSTIKAKMKSIKDVKTNIGDCKITVTLPIKKIPQNNKIVYSKCDKYTCYGIAIFSAVCLLGTLTYFYIVALQ